MKGIDELIGEYKEWGNKPIYGKVIQDLEQLKEQLKEQHKEEFIEVPDIRNKLTPVTNLISLIELGNDYGKFIDEALVSAKRSVNYLAKRAVYKQTREKK